MLDGRHHSGTAANMKDEIEALVNAIAGRLGLRGDEAAKAIEDGRIVLEMTDRDGRRTVRASHAGTLVEIDMIDLAVAAKARRDAGG
jgi:hypothetical protein